MTALTDLTHRFAQIVWVGRVVPTRCRECGRSRVAHLTETEARIAARLLPSYG